MSEQKVRVTPRVSVNKLAEYMVATPARRRAIIRDQKNPRDIIVARYQDVYSAIAQCLAGGLNVSLIYERIERLYSATPKTTWEAQDKQLSAEALESFLTFVDEIDLTGVEAIRPAESLPALNVSGVHVSVRPVVLLRQQGSDSIVGAVHLAVSKLFALTGEAAAYAGTVIHEFVEELAHAKARPEHSYIVDVFARQVHHAPRAYRKRRKDIAAACEEIAQRWAVV